MSVEYYFDLQFRDQLVDGTKRGTIRRMRTRPQRHAHEGELLELSVVENNMRRMMKRAECAGVDGIFLDLDRDVVRLGHITTNRSTWPDLDAGGREGLAQLLGFRGWKSAAAYYGERYGRGPFTGSLVAWRELEYDGPKPSKKQLEALRVLTEHAIVIPSRGKFHPVVGHSLLVLKWASTTYREDLYGNGKVPISITELGKWILERFDKK